MLALRRGAYGWSGLAAAILSAIRPNGVLFIVFALAVICRRDGVWDTLRFWSRPGRFTPVVLAPFGLFGYWWFCYLLTGDAFAQASSVRAGWGWVASWPWIGLASAFTLGEGHERFWIASSLVAFAVSLLLLRYRYYEEFAFCVVSFLLVWSGTIPNSLLRYSIVLFPITIALARFLDPRPTASMLMVAALAAVNGMLMTAWTMHRVIAI